MAAQPESIRFTRAGPPFGWVVYLGVAASMTICYSRPVGELLTGGGALNPHVQAVLMWMLGLVALFGLWRDRMIHGTVGPLLVGLLGLIVVAGSLYIHYVPIVEMSGYLLLVASALVNQNAMLQKLNEQVMAQSDALTAKGVELEELNASLQEQVFTQVGQIERLARLRRFLAPAVAAAIAEDEESTLLQSHRRDIAVLFCDLRGFSAFSETMEPEEVMGVLQAYHESLGRLVDEAGGTIDHRAGDGLMVFFNDPVPCPEPAVTAVTLALAMRAGVADLQVGWNRRGYGLGFGVGVATGFATIGIVGFEGRFDYTANGNAVNLASRLCDHAANGEILVSRRTFLDVEGQFEIQPGPDLTLKGLSQPAAVFKIVGHAVDG
ncbi:MAG: adenylate/guanylate cyclase domain-containing protein [Pseudomonadota bacterium]